MLSHKYKLILTKDKENIIKSCLHSLKQIWNDNKHISSYKTLCELTKNYTDNPFLYSQCKQQLMKKLSLSWTAYFKDKKKKGKPKDKNQVYFILYPQAEHCKLNTTNNSLSYVHLPKIGELSFFKHNNEDLENIKQILIKKQQDGYYIIFFCNKNKEKELNTDKCLGIDIGFKQYLTLSNKKKINLERYKKRYQRIKNLQKKLKKKFKGNKKLNIRCSKNYSKVK